MMETGTSKTVCSKCQKVISQHKCEGCNHTCLTWDICEECSKELDKECQDHLKKLKKLEKEKADLDWAVGDNQ